MSNHIYVASTAQLMGFLTLFSRELSLVILVKNTDKHLGEGGTQMPACV
ncbi:MAG: hypothetical protein MUO58_13170 [Anaerolineales bacterium]|nr:hypothetical protein [Anaerolineales bacterium]